LLKRTDLKRQLVSTAKPDKKNTFTDNETVVGDLKGDYIFSFG
jgi:hypothetical protein